MKIKSIPDTRPIYYISDQFGEYFSGFKYGKCHFSSKIGEAVELQNPQHFKNMKRWESTRQLKCEYL